MARTHIDLQRWENKRRHTKRCITRFAHTHKALFIYRIIHMNIFSALHADGGLVLKLSTIGLVVMANEHTSLVWKREQTFNLVKQSFRIATREITAGGTSIRHK
jgi:hypothetical protein